MHVFYMHAQQGVHAYRSGQVNASSISDRVSVASVISSDKPGGWRVRVEGEGWRVEGKGGGYRVQGKGTG